MIFLLLLQSLQADPISRDEYLDLSNLLMQVTNKSRELGICVTHELSENAHFAFWNHYQALKRDGFPDQSEKDSGELAKRCEGERK